jgi:hypothetical protein
LCYKPDPDDRDDEEFDPDHDSHDETTYAKVVAPPPQGSDFK